MVCLFSLLKTMDLTIILPSLGPTNKVVMNIVMPYIGGCLSCNNYKIVGRGGRPTNCTKPEVRTWMTDLASKVSKYKSDLPMEERVGWTPITIRLTGYFVDGRVPDLHNLHKVIGDAIKEGLQVDDKTFNFVDVGYETGSNSPFLEIEII